MKIERNDTFNNNGVFIDVMSLKDNLNSLENKPGYYKWYCEKEQLDELLNKLELSFSDIKDDIECIDNKYYCIYVGIAVNESIRKRLNWHINDKHSEGRVKNGIISTLRKSLSSILFNNQYEKDKTNDFIYKLYVEFFLLDYDIKSDKAKKEIRGLEARMINEKYRLLNIQGNHYKGNKFINIKQGVKQLRREGLKNGNKIK